MAGVDIAGHVKRKVRTGDRPTANPPTNVIANSRLDWSTIFKRSTTASVAQPLIVHGDSIRLPFHPPLGLISTTFRTPFDDHSKNAEDDASVRSIGTFRKPSSEIAVMELEDRTRQGHIHRQRAGGERHPNTLVSNQPLVPSVGF